MHEHDRLPEATVFVLTAEEGAEPEGLARSTKTEYRLRQRARIVLSAADGSQVSAADRSLDEVGRRDQSEIVMLTLRTLQKSWLNN